MPCDREDSPAALAGLRAYPRITGPQRGIPLPTGPDVGGPVNEIEDPEDYSNAVRHRVRDLLLAAGIDPDTVVIQGIRDSAWDDYQKGT